MDRGLRAQGRFPSLELLAAISIVALLAAIAIPQFSAYRKRGYENEVKSDLRNAATAEEAFFAQNLAYKSGTLTSGDLPGFNQTPHVTTVAAIGTNNYLLTATHALCAGVTWTYDSATGTISAPASGCP
jgi:type IV pilus assembly protein PilA